MDGLNAFLTVMPTNTTQLTNRTAEFLPATVRLTWDANGNLIGDGLRAFAYDAANRLAGVTITNLLRVEYTYDGLGRRRVRRE